MGGFPGLIESYIREKQEAKGVDFCVSSWLDSASKRASQISVATHVIKFSHSDAKGTNVKAKLSALNSDNSPYVTTDSLRSVKSDVVGNAAAMDVGVFLQLEVDGVSLLDLIAKNDVSPFASFADSEARLLTWMSGFKTVLTDQKLSSDTLAKQVYFPVGQNNYHLLAPLYASSVSQSLYDKIREDRYGEKAKESRDCKKKGLRSDGEVVDYPNLAVQTFGGTKPLNISRLNSLRGGKSFLLRSAPPIWKTIAKPLLRKNAFWQMYDRKAYLILKDFQKFLLVSKSPGFNSDIRGRREDYLDQLLDILILVALEIQSMKSGWSVASEIPVHEQIWLDPLRNEFKELREDEDWMKNVSSHFAKWIIDKLKYKESSLDFWDAEYIHLKKECLEILKAVS